MVLDKNLICSTINSWFGIAVAHFAMVEDPTDTLYPSDLIPIEIKN